MKFGTAVNWPTFKTPEQRCPACRYELSATTAVQHDCSPSEGDLTVCIGCGAVLVFCDGLGLLVMESDAFAALPLDVQAKVHRVRAAVLFAGGKG